ncbi:MAG TPA: hypothetical protein VFQ61_20290 [Polyangiaceae bacterium]|nr:hypothetical protein [Polyangiaceae bacterium]
MVERLASNTLGIGLLVTGVLVGGCSADGSAPQPTPNLGPGAEYPADDPGTRAFLQSEPGSPSFSASVQTETETVRARRIRFQASIKEFPTPNTQPLDEATPGWAAKNGVEAWFSALNFSGAYTTIGNWNTDICVLRGFRGDFDPTIPNSPTVGVGVLDAANGNIVFQASNTLAEAYAYCTPRSTFSGPNNFWPYQDVRDYRFMWDPNPLPNVIGDTAGLSWNVAIPFFSDQYAFLLSGLGYNFTDAASAVSVFRGTGSLRSKSPYRIYVQATPVRLRDNVGGVKVSGSNGTGDPALVTAWTVSSVGPVNNILQTGKSKNTHVCFFSSVSGNFQADTWAIFNLNANNQWQVDARGGTNGSIKLGVLCMPRAQ